MRITNNIRESLVDALTDHKFTAAKAALKERANELGEQLYRVAIPQDVEKMMDDLNKKMPGALQVTTNVSIYMDGWHRLGLTFARPVPSTDNLSTIIKQKWSEAERGAFVAYLDAAEELGIAIKSARQAARAVLERCNTLKQLEAAWPDAMPVFMPVLTKYGAGATPNVPMIEVEKLNSMFDLPPEQKEAA